MNVTVLSFYNYISHIGSFRRTVSDRRNLRYRKKRMVYEKRLTNLKKIRSQVQLVFKIFMLFYVVFVSFKFFVVVVVVV